MNQERLKDHLVIIIALLGGVKFKLFGTFYASEIIIIILSVFISWKNVKNNKYAWNLFKLACLWIAFSIATDLYVNNSTINSLKGTVSIILFAIQFPVAYWLLCDKPVRFLYYIVIIGLVSIPNLYLFGPEIDEKTFGEMGENIWLYYAMVPLATGCISWLYYKNKINAKVCSILIGGFGLFMLFHNSRNVFLTMAMAAIILYQISCYKSPNFNLILAKYKRSTIKTFILLFIGLIAVNAVYEHLAGSGALGAYAYQKYVKQSQAESILEGGRSETFMGIELIKRSPIIGYGNYATDRRNAFHRQYAKDHNLTFIPLQNDLRLPAHSYIVGSWMANGLGGGIFWIYVIFLMWQVFKSGTFLIYPKLLPLTLISFMQLAWNILFSPFGLRMPVSFFLMFLCIIYLTHKHHSYSNG